MPSDKISGKRAEEYIEILLERHGEGVNARNIDRALGDGAFTDASPEMSAAIAQRLTTLGISLEKADEKTWGAINRKARDQRRRTAVGRLQTVAAIFLCVVVLMAMTTAGAYALKWRGYMQIINPLVDLLGLNWGFDEIQDTAPKGKEDKEVSADKSIRSGNQDELPVRSHGYAVSLPWIPERFAFDYFSLLDSKSEFNMSVCYTADKEELLFTVSILLTEEAQQIAAVETDYGVVAEFVGESPVIISPNYEKLVVSWVDGQAVYHVSGTLDEDEARRVVTAFFER